MEYLSLLDKNVFASKKKDYVLNNSTKVKINLLNEISILLFFNQCELDDYHSTLINKRLVENIFSITKVKILKKEYILKKYFELTQLLNDTIYFKDYEINLTNDALMCNISMFKIKTFSMIYKTFNYFACNKEFFNSKYNLVNNSKLREKLKKKTYNMKFNDQMKIYYIEKKTFKKIKYIENFKMNFNLDIKILNIHETRNILNDADNTNTIRINRTKTVVNTPIKGLDFDQLNENLKSTQINQTDKFNSTYLINKKTSNTNLFQINPIDFTKTYSSTNYTSNPQSFLNTIPINKNSSLIDLSLPISTSTIPNVSVLHPIKEAHSNSYSAKINNNSYNINNNIKTENLGITIKRSTAPNKNYHSEINKLSMKDFSTILNSLTDKFVCLVSVY